MKIKIEKFKNSTNPVSSLFGICYICGASQYDNEDFIKSAITLCLNGPSNSCEFCLCKDCAKDLYLRLSKFV